MKFRGVNTMNKRLWIITTIFVVTGIILTSVVLIYNRDSDEAHSVVEDNPNSEFLDERDTIDWCTEHSVPESECTQCNPSLIDNFKATGDWCGGHGIPESHCRLCNPEIIFPQEKIIALEKTVPDWCTEHSVPESECTQCNPSLIDSFKESGDWCGGHGIPESHCRLCNPEIIFPQEEIIRALSLETADKEVEVSLYFRHNQNICATNDALIQFASSKTADKTGITIFRTIRTPFETEFNAPAEIVFDENSTTVIATSVKALVSRWQISPGEVVMKDDPIAILQSSEMAELQARLLSAFAELEVQKKELERNEALTSKSLIRKSDYERQIAINKKAHADYVSVRGLLLTSGMSDTDIDEILESSIVSSEFILRAPRKGLIAKRIAQLGELLEDGHALALMTDPTSLWIEAHLTEDQMKQAGIGQDLYFTADNGALNNVKGKIIWVSPYLDSHTRTGIVRAQVVSHSQNLRAGTFGRITISETYDTESILIPKDAVQWEGCCNVVFVRESVIRYRPRKVQIADGPGSYYRVTQGLSHGDEIVVKGSFLLKTELKKTSIGAGCCGIEPVG